MIYCGDALKVLKSLPDKSVNCCVTSPPYWGLRDYGVDGQIGLEESIDEHLKNLVAVFREVRRVLRNDGTLWVNYGDAYSGSWKGKRKKGAPITGIQKSHKGSYESPTPILKSGLAPKNLFGLPWRLAFALQDDGWILRSDIIWEKPNATPESTKDRPTKAHEYIFLLSKKPKYYYDHEAIKEDRTSNEDANTFRGGSYVKNDIDNQGLGSRKVKGNKKYDFIRPNSKGALVPGNTDPKRAERAERADTHLIPKRNRRTIWKVATKPFKEAHFATFPPDLIRPCILAGCPENGTVLDPFFGAGTTGLVAIEENRRFIGIELNPEYVELAKSRLRKKAFSRGG